MTQVLRKNDGLANVIVSQVKVERIGAEVGFLDSLGKLTIQYEAVIEAAPASLVIKFSSTDETYRSIGTFYNAYEREFLFYEQLASGVPIRLPRCYGREINPQSGAHLLILEDLSALTPGNQVQGMTPAQALATVETMGRFHAHWWSAPQLESLSWMPRRNIQSARYQAAWPKFLEEYRPHLSARAIELGESLCTQLEVLLARCERGPTTIVHSDLRADNLLYDASSDTATVVVLDWQLAIRGPGMLDVARLLCGSLNPADRAACEKMALKLWHETLERGGVSNYAFEQVLADYLRCSLVCLYYPVTIHAAEEAAGQRGTALAHAQIERFFTAATELQRW